MCVCLSFLAQYGSTEVYNSVGHSALALSVKFVCVCVCVYVCVCVCPVVVVSQYVTLLRAHHLLSPVPAC